VHRFDRPRPAAGLGRTAQPSHPSSLRPLVELPPLEPSLPATMLDNLPDEVNLDAIAPFLTLSSLLSLGQVNKHLRAVCSECVVPRVIAPPRPPDHMRCELTPAMLLLQQHALEAANPRRL
jgi:hypothetical protein